MKNNLFFCFLAFIIISCSKKNPAAPAPVFSKIVILGNSITYSPKSPDYGWEGDWGMAASKAESDFVHILTKDFREKNPSSTVTIKNIAVFERDFVNFNFDTELKALKDSKPDLVIIRIGENVQQPVVDSLTFEKRYTDLITYFKSNNPDVRIFAAGSFWGNPTADRIMAKQSPFITLRTLSQDLSNAAWGKFENPGVQSHPSDKGMNAIAGMIWAGIGKLK